MRLRKLLSDSLMVLILVGSGPFGLAADGNVVQQVSANGQRNLRPFTIKDKWEIQWDSKSSLLNITIFTSDGKIFDPGPMQQGPGKGSSFQPKGGDYYLGVSGTGEWTVTVVQLP